MVQLKNEDYSIKHLYYLALLSSLPCMHQALPSPLQTQESCSGYGCLCAVEEQSWVAIGQDL